MPPQSQRAVDYRDTSFVPSWYRDPSAPEPNNPRKIGAAALIERDGSLLLDQREDDGSWGLIAGTVEEDETVTGAVMREIQEETGLIARSAELFGIFSDPTRIVGYTSGNVYRVLTVVFVVSIDDGEPRASQESLDVRFVPFEDLAKFDLTPAHRPIVDAFLARPSRVVVA